MSAYGRAINSDRCPDAVAAAAVLLPVLAVILAALAIAAVLAH